MKVMCFGTFDMFHPGHEYFLNEAKKFGNELVVVVARDKTVNEIKGFYPKEDEKKRLQNIIDSKIAEKVVLGDEILNKYNVLGEKPDIIALGYDQKYFLEHLQDELNKRNLKTKIVRLDSFHPEKYKSSKLR
ncbi:FAD synthase [Candidatus Woesearchaeota archaeon]|nr:MAG: FAD synthase [Candidatus Woesearchaeota archaeon]